MTPDCIEGALIEIQCRNFYNPIVPEKTYGFNVFIYDNEVDQQVIESTENNKVYLDATGLLPATIPT